MTHVPSVAVDLGDLMGRIRARSQHVLRAITKTHPEIAANILSIINAAEIFSADAEPRF